MTNNIPIHKHVYQVFYIESIKIMAFTKIDAKTIVKKKKPKVIITKVKKIAD